MLAHDRGAASLFACATRAVDLPFQGGHMVYPRFPGRRLRGCAASLCPVLLGPLSKKTRKLSTSRGRSSYAGAYS